MEKRTSLLHCNSNRQFRKRVERVEGSKWTNRVKAAAAILTKDGKKLSSKIERVKGSLPFPGIHSVGVFFKRINFWT